MNSHKFIRVFIALIVVVVYCKTHVQAQTISGTINEPNQKAAIYASVALYNAKDSSLMKGAATDEQGKFELTNITKGKYFITASFVGFNNVNSKIFDFDGKNYSVETLTLNKAENNLKEVTVTSSKPLIEVKADKLIVNVEGSINSTGLNALELLQKSPGVQVDKDDNVLIQGKQGVKIYIDGRPSPLAGKDLAATLKSMNAADIETIEIITNPSAKYDAAGNLGIINIRLKKNKKLGTNGNIAINPRFGTTPKIDLSGSLNYRDKKWNLFSNLSFEQGIWHNTTFDDKTINNTNYNKIWHGQWSDTVFNVKAGADYFLDSKNTIGILVNLGQHNNSSNGQSTTLIGNRYTENTDSAVLQSTATSPGKSTNINYNLNYRFADTIGHELTIDADFGTYNSNRFTYQPNYYTFSDRQLSSISRIYQQQTPTDITIISFKADYEQNLGKGKLGYGIKGSSVKSNNTFDFFNVQNEIALRDTDKSNSFGYSEKILAAYINYNTQLTKKWSLQAGLRIEKTYSLGNLVSFKKNELDKVDTSYLNLFPSFALTYNVSKNHSLNLNYSLRIGRPSYQDLNPFEFKIDELVFEKGNPFLRPNYTNSLKLTHTFKSILTTSVSYRYTKDVFNQTTSIDKDRTYFKTENFNNSYDFTIETSLNTPIAKWLDLNSTLSLFHYVLKGILQNEFAIDAISTSYNFNGSANFKLNTILSFELSGWLNGPNTGLYVSKAQGIMDAGMKIKLFNDAANLKISFTDVLNTVGWTALYNHGGVYNNLSGVWEARQLRLNFDYRFGSSEIKGARNHKSSSEEEANRIK